MPILTVDAKMDEIDIRPEAQAPVEAKNVEGLFRPVRGGVRNIFLAGEIEDEGRGFAAKGCVKVALSQVVTS